MGEGGVPEPLLSKRFEGGDAFLTVDADPVAGYRVWAQGLGLHLVSADGASLWTCPSAAEPWLARKLAAAQVFPLLAVLNGVEVLHAAAVELDGAVVAMLAASGTGKTSTTAHLIAAGASFVADDGLGVEPAAGGAIAHPGPRTLNVAEEEVGRLAPEGRDRLGRELGSSRIGDGAEVHFEPPTRTAASGLDGLVLLERTAAPYGSVEPLEQAATAILGSCHVSYLSSPRRQLRQLDVVSAIVSGTRLARLTIGSSEPAPAVADRLARWWRGA